MVTPSWTARRQTERTVSVPTDGGDRSSRALVYLSGTFVGPTGGNVIQELRRVIDNSAATELVIDLTSVIDISFRHLTDLASLARRARQLGRRVVLANPSLNLCRQTAQRLQAYEDRPVVALSELDGEAPRYVDRLFATSVMDSLFDVGLRLTVIRSMLEHGLQPAPNDASAQLASTVDELDQLITKVRDAAAPPALTAEQPPRHLRVEIDGFEIRAPIAHLYGELDAASHDYVALLVASLRGPAVVADLAGVSFIDARGVAALMRAKRSLKEQERRLRVTGANGAVRRVIEILGLEGPLSE